MECGEVQKLLEPYLDQQLSSAEMQELVEGHLADCTNCVKEFVALRGLKLRVQALDENIEIPQSLENDLIQMITTQPPVMAQEKCEIVPATESHPLYRPRAIICERHELIRFGLKRLVAEVLDVVGETSDGAQALDLALRTNPDIVLLDVDLDVLPGLDLTRKLVQMLPKCNVLVLTDSYHHTKYHHQLLRSGARGFCLKSSGPRLLFDAIDLVRRSLSYCDPEIAQLIKQKPANKQLDMTEREIDVLIRLDLRNKEIAEELDLKLRTVEKHIESILAKFKVPTRTAAALKAVQMGFVLLPKMPKRDPVTGVSHEHQVAEMQAELAIANAHLKALLTQNDLLRSAYKSKTG